MYLVGLILCWGRVSALKIGRKKFSGGVVLEGWFGIEDDFIRQDTSRFQVYMRCAACLKSNLMQIKLESMLGQWFDMVDGFGDPIDLVTCWQSHGLTTSCPTSFFYTKSTFSTSFLLVLKFQSKILFLSFNFIWSIDPGPGYTYKSNGSVWMATNVNQSSSRDQWIFWKEILTTLDCNQPHEYLSLSLLFFLLLSHITNNEPTNHQSKLHSTMVCPSSTFFHHTYSLISVFVLCTWNFVD